MPAWRHPGGKGGLGGLVSLVGPCRLQRVYQWVTSTPSPPALEGGTRQPRFVDEEPGNTGAAIPKRGIQVSLTQSSVQPLAGD